MSSPDLNNQWLEVNQQALMAELERLRQLLEQHISAQSQSEKPRPQGESAPRQNSSSNLERLCNTFGLSPFERDLLLLCAGMELDARFVALYSTAQSDPARPYPTFSLALAALPEAHWSAITPAGPLRRWRLIEVGSGSALLFSPLRLDERVLHYLTGVQYLDERLSGLVEPVAAGVDLVPGQQQLVEQLINAWSGTTNAVTLPLIQLYGDNLTTQRLIAAQACSRLGLGLYLLSASVVPAEPRELEAFMRLWEREAALSTTALLLECEQATFSDPARERVLNRLIEEMAGAFMVSGPVRRRTRQRPLVSFEVPRPGFAEQRAVWEFSLGNPLTHRLNGQLERLVSQFSLDASTIQAVGQQALHRVAEGQTQTEELAKILWQECRSQARPRLDDLAQRLDSEASWQDLVLPEQPYQLLREIARHARQRAKVYESWGFGGKAARGLGLSALFAGPSGTGKTLAAEVLAAELQLDLYRIDLSQVVSKYIGETEKNLRRVFDAAEYGGAVLLFDEADALFGKRSEVKDSHDRYANIEISYLLQRMEAYRGLAILTTNLKSALDSAFLRRLRFIVQFPFPNTEQRAEIWRRSFPAATPTEGLDVTKLARLNLAGGNIRNIALNAAFLAADADEPVRMAHLLRAARTECAKLEKPLTEAEIGGWS